MSFRFFRRVKIAPGLGINFSKRGMSVSLGGRGARFTTGTSGNRVTVRSGIPGLFYTRRLPSSTPRRDGYIETSGIQGVIERLRPGMVSSLFLPAEEKAFLEGLRLLFEGSEHESFEKLLECHTLPDAAFLLGFLFLKRENYADAAQAFLHTLHGKDQLGSLYEKYEVIPSIALPVTEQITAGVQPDVRGVLLGLAEVWQLQDEYEKASDCLRQLVRIDESDPVARLSLAELLVETAGDNKAALDETVKLAADTKNDSDVHAALLLYKGKALSKLGLLKAARDTLTAACRRTRNRSESLLRTIRYERAMVYEALGEEKKAHVELEKLYSEDPEYKEVRKKLNLV
jgi:tetratricopeptide (TPR) repeat protein